MRGDRDARLPRGTVTLLLADVEGSTRLWEVDPRAAGAAMADLNAHVDELVTKFGGHRPVEQGEGDSFVAAFARASDAIGCAIELQSRTSNGPARLRMALHTGEVEEGEDGRITGRAMIRAARVRDLAHGGQVLLTAATREAARDAMPEGADLVDVGSHELKGLDRPEHVHQLTHVDLREDFPPLGTAHAACGNIPVQLTTFVGREQELADIARLIETTRLVTLTGAGGCGKTRLAIEVAGRIADAFPDGVWFCDLGPLVSPDAVAALVCTVVGASAERHATNVDAVCERLAQSKALVLLDNCEHLIDASATLTDAVLRRCPDVRVVATSREPLGVEGEVAWRVPSLSTPEDDSGDLSSFEAIRLFVERASQRRPGFALTAENGNVISEICARLDGIPLAIELAAARVRVLSLEQIAAGLNDRFRFLGRGARTLLPRQQTLEASVAWSHDLLTDPQRMIFRRLAAFSGRFSLEAAERVASGDGVEEAEVLELLSQLVDRSLVAAEDVAGNTYYRLLETVRHYARQLLVQAGEAPSVGTRHLDWYLSLALDCRERSDADVPWIAYAPLEPEYDNLRAACEWAVGEKRVEPGLRLVSVLVDYTGHRTIAARFRECLSWLNELLPFAEDVEARVQVEAFIADGLARGMLAEFKSAEEPSRRAVEIARGLADPVLLGRALFFLGMHLNVEANWEEARSCLREAVTLARTISDGRTYVVASFQLAINYLFQAQIEAALTIANELCDLSERGGWEPTTIRLIRGACLFLRGDVTGGLADLQTAAVGVERVGDIYWVSNVQAVLGWAAQRQGRHLDARAHLERAVTAAEGFALQTAQARMFLARTMLDLGDREACADLLGANERLTERWRDTMIGDWAVATHAALNAMLCLEAGRIEDARRLAADADGLSDKPHTYALFTAPNHILAALVERRAGEFASAESIIGRTLERIATEGSYVFAPDALDVTASLRADMGADADAARFFAAAREGRRRMATVPDFALVWDAEAEIDALRERMGTEAFAEVWAAGERLTLDDAVAYAMRGRGARRRPQAGWDSLTPTERQVVNLVAEGLTNKKIGERLFVSPRTVSTHLSHVFAKLGVSSRSELTAAAAKRA